MSKGIDRRTLLKGASTATIMALLRGEADAAPGADTATAAAKRERGALDSAGRRAFSGNQTITMLVPDRLYRVGCVVRAERLSWLPADLEGFEPVNSYVLTDPNNCVFFEMGLPIARPALQQAVETLVGNRKVYVDFTRNEADCIGNMGYILGTCPNPTLLYGTAGGILEWINDPAVALLEVRNFLGRIPIESAHNGESKDIGELRFEWFDSAIKMMLMTQWAYEKSTKCLFTSEAFGFRHAPTMDSPVVIDSPRNLPSADSVAREIVARCNWMREADFPNIMTRVKSIFDEHDIEFLAPVHGCVIKGHAAIAAHVKVTLEALHIASKIPDQERLQYV